MRSPNALVESRVLKPPSGGFFFIGKENFLELLNRYSKFPKTAKSGDMNPIYKEIDNE